MKCAITGDLLAAKSSNNLVAGGICYDRDALGARIQRLRRTWIDLANAGCAGYVPGHGIGYPVLANQGLGCGGLTLPGLTSSGLCTGEQHEGYEDMRNSRQSSHQGPFRRN